MTVNHVCHLHELILKVIPEILVFFLYIIGASSLSLYPYKSGPVKLEMVFEVHTASKDPSETIFFDAFFCTTAIVL